LTDLSTEEAMVARVAERAREVTAGQWILGYGWDEGAWADDYPTMTYLSSRVPNHPVYLKGLHGFAVWGNRLAFQRAGITSETVAPEGGEILRDIDGNLTGVLLNRARTLLENAIPDPTQEQLEAQILTGLEHMASSGFVMVHEAGTDSVAMAAFDPKAFFEDRSPDVPSSPSSSPPPSKTASRAATLLVFFSAAARAWFIPPDFRYPHRHLGLGVRESGHAATLDLFQAISNFPRFFLAPEVRIERL